MKIFERILTMRPEHVAEKALRAIEHRKPRVLIGFTAKAPDVMGRVLPGAYLHVMAASEWVLGSAFNRWLTRRQRR